MQRRLLGINPIPQTPTLPPSSAPGTELGTHTCRTGQKVPNWANREEGSDLLGRVGRRVTGAVHGPGAYARSGQRPAVLFPAPQTGPVVRDQVRERLQGLR